MRRYAVALIALLVLTAGCSSHSPQIEEADPSSPSSTDVGGEPDSEPQEPSSGPDGPAKFGQTYAYQDGLKITITKIQRRGTGVIFTIRMLNGTKERLDASEATINTSYGKDGHQAECCVTGDLSVDEGFQGMLLPKHSKSASFSFKIPRDGMHDVVVEVYPTYDDDPAIFEGAIK